MDDTCRILLLCDDELTGHELRQIIGAELVIEAALSAGHSRTIGLEYEEVVLSGVWEMPVREAQYDLCIVSLSGGSLSPFMAGNPLMRDAIHGVLFLLDANAQPDAEWRPRRHRDRVLQRPVTATGLAQAVEQLLVGALQRRPPAIVEERYLALLKSQLDLGRKQLKPVLKPDHPRGFCYPAAIEAFGYACDDLAALEHLVGHGICSKTVACRVRGCPRCASLELAYGEVCGRCSSVDYARETVIHHFACAHVDTLARFRRGDDLVCPKCTKQLRQIGRDYEKPAECYQCRACSFISPDTKVLARCQNCQHSCPPEQTEEQLVYAYEFTSRAAEAVAAGSLSGFDLESVLRHQITGLYAKSFFAYEIDREHLRFKRYATPSSLLMVRLDNLPDMRARHPGQCSEYMERICGAITSQLRDLDLTSIWSADVLAVLLPATAAEGARVVSERMQRNVAECRFEAIEGRPDVSIAIATTHERFAGGKDLLRACLEALGGGELSADHTVTTAQDQYVIIDEDTTVLRGMEERAR